MGVIEDTWDFWFRLWEGDPDDYYLWQCQLAEERAPA
jgi:hypothetical protein